MSPSKAKNCSTLQKGKWTRSTQPLGAYSGPKTSTQMNANNARNINSWKANNRSFQKRNKNEHRGKWIWSVKVHRKFHHLKPMEPEHHLNQMYLTCNLLNNFITFHWQITQRRETSRYAAQDPSKGKYRTTRFFNTVNPDTKKKKDVNPKT